MQKTLKAGIIVIIILLIGAFLAYKFIYNKPHPDYEQIKTEAFLEASDLFDDFKINSELSAQKYNGKMLEISGIYKEIEDHDSVMIIVFAFESGMFGDEGVRCTFLPKYYNQLKEGKDNNEIRIKGFCSGYNQTDVILEKCSIIK